MSETSGMTITEFLEARIADDETAAARHLAALSSHGLGDYGIRVRAECAAKWAIIDSYIAAVSAQHDTWRPRHDIDDNRRDEKCLLRVLKTIAKVYADHPDYQQDWAL